MVKKKVDSRIRTLVENGVNSNHRTFFVVVGDKARDQVITLHYLLSKASVKARPNVLWCYKKDLGFISTQQNTWEQRKKKIKAGAIDAEKSPFDTFISTTKIRYTYYSESHKILGNTFGMLVLQDFEAITPNLLARTMETVEGGGVIVLLLKTMTSLKQLYTLTMDVHSRFRTEAERDVVGRFNERFLLSLSTCANSIVVDDELNILPISTHIRNLESLADTRDEDTPEMAELKELKKSLKDTHPIGELVSVTRTVDQGKAVLQFIEAISEKTLRSTVTLTASRGRGKSAALGVSIAAAVAFGYSNIFVTSPNPENLVTLFDFVFKGFDALGYKEHLDYELLRSSNPEFNNAIVRINIFKSHRQTIQYIQPQDSQKLGQAELVVIDEAAAIPLPYVKNLMGPYLVFMSSTINGYEGTGRSLSLKLIKQLREGSTGTSGRTLRELQLKEPIRYSNNDPVESWLNRLLCLDATTVPAHLTGCPHPNDCQLFYVNRDTLFSFHKQAETFLQKMVALYVSSHYKNSPNDLLLMSDAPAHHLFVLLGPVDPTSNALPEILCAVQVCFEGRIMRENVMANLERGVHTPGDLIPWTISQQFADYEFAGLSGARIVRIATHPDYQKMGYGSRALQLLVEYFQGEIMSVEEEESDEEKEKEKEEEEEEEEEVSLLTEKIKPKKKLPPLLLQLSERPAEKLHYIGVSYGVTGPLMKFWTKAKFEPVYMRLTPNETTGEHTTIMLRPLKTQAQQVAVSQNWAKDFADDFKRRFISLLGYDFRSFESGLALSVLRKKVGSADDSAPEGAPSHEKALKEINDFFTPYDLKRIHSYSDNLLDFHVVLDAMPLLARLYFLDRFGETRLSPVQAQIMVAIGLQFKDVEVLSKELNFDVTQSLAIFNKAVRKLSRHMRGLQEEEAEKTLPEKPKLEHLKPLDASLADDFGIDADRNVLQKNLINSLVPDMEQYKIAGEEDTWRKALATKGGKGTVSLPSSKDKTKNLVKSNNTKKDKKGGDKKDKRDGKRSKHGDDKTPKKRRV